MNDRRALAASLQTLLAGLAAHGDRHLLEVQADLRQTRYLLAAASDKLGASFIGMHAAMAAQQTLLGADAGADAATEVAHAVPATLQRQLAQLQVQGRTHADAAMTALQFEDMTAQLIERIVGHVDSLQAFLGAVSAGAQALAEGAAAADADDADADTAVAAVLTSLNGLLTEQAGVAPAVAGKSVAQTHMDSGDIELF